MSYVLTNHIVGEPPAILTNQVALTTRYGDDGPANGPSPEVILAGPSGETTARHTWDAGVMPDGTWGGWGSFRMEAQTGGTTTAHDDEGSPADLSDAVNPVGQIADITFAMYTSLAGSTVEFSDVDVTFYQGSQAVDSRHLSYTTGAAAGADGTSDEQLVDVVSREQADRVVITAGVSFAVAQGTYPAPDDLVAEIGVSASQYNDPDPIGVTRPPVVAPAPNPLPEYDEAAVSMTAGFPIDDRTAYEAIGFILA